MPDRLLFRAARALPGGGPERVARAAFLKHEHHHDRISSSPLGFRSKDTPMILKKKKTATTDPSPPPADRTRYFARMLVTPEDLTRDQEYHIKKRRYWVRRLHGWGAVSGLETDRYAGTPPKNYVSDAVLLSVTAGDALDVWGREINLSREALVDIAHMDAQCHSIIVSGDGANPSSAGTSPPFSAGATCLFAVRYREALARFVPSPGGQKADGSEACEPTLRIDSHVFALLPGGSGAAEAASEQGWVVLATIEHFNQTGMAVLPDDRDDFPIDPLDAAEDGADNMVRALAEGNLDRALGHLNRWEDDIARGLRRLLNTDGLVRLKEIGPRGRLEEIPAKYLALSHEHPLGSERLREFFIRTESPFEPHRKLSVVCISRLSRQEFTERVRFVFRSDEISDAAIHDAHRGSVPAHGRGSSVARPHVSRPFLLVAGSTRSSNLRPTIAR